MRPDVGTPRPDEIEEGIHSARREALRPLPWPARDARPLRHQEALAGGAVRYCYGSFFVDVGPDGRIIVSTDDWISKYALAIEGAVGASGKFGRIENGRLVPVENENLIRAGETLVHLPTAERQRLTALLGERLEMQTRFTPTDPEERMMQPFRMQQQVLFGDALPLPLARARDKAAVELLVGYARNSLDRVDQLDEQGKQEYFLTSTTATTAILLYEFATGEGAMVRRFDERHAITGSLKSSRILDDILEAFALHNANQTDASRLAGTPAGAYEEYTFSPDDTSTPAESLAKHINAIDALALGNDLYLFLGGVRYRGDVDATNGSVRVLVRDAKTARSLMAHAVENRDRVNFEPTPLGTTVQEYSFSVPIPWERINLASQ